MNSDTFSNKAEAFEAFDDTPLSPRTDATIGAVIARRYSRRDVLKGALGVTATTALFGTAALTAASGPAKAATAGFAFRELASGVDERDHVAEGYEIDVLIRWGDPLFNGLSPFTPASMTAADQARRFGYNNDYIAFFPLEGSSTRALLCVNHEYANPEVMFPNLGGRPDRNDFAQMTNAHIELHWRPAGRCQPPKVTFVTRLQPSQSPSRTARQVPDLSTIIRVRSSLTDGSRLGAHC